MKNVLTIIKKELARVFTDKRMILSLFLLPPLTIYLIYGLMGMSAEKETTKVNEYIPNVYLVNSPEELTLRDNVKIGKFFDLIFNITKDGTNPYYKQDKINLISIEESKIEEYIEKVNNQQIELLIVFPSDFENQVVNYQDVDKTPEVTMYYNINNQYSQNTYYNFQSILNNYSSIVLNARVENQNLLKVFNSIPVGKGNVEKAQGQMLSMILPMLIVIYLMAGAMGVGIESISGEKERGTIATLLVTPIKRSELAIGKIFSIAIIGLLSSIASFIGLVAVLPTFSKISGGQNSGMKLNYEMQDYLMLLTIMLVAVLLFVTLIVIISAYAKTVKEAGTLIMPLYLLVLGAAMFNMFGQTVDKAVTSYMIPVFNIILSLKALFGFELLPLNWFVTIISTLVYTLILIFIIQKMFKSEKIMFNK